MTPEKKILLWTVLAAITIMVFSGCASPKVESRKQKAEISTADLARITPPGLVPHVVMGSARTVSDVGVAATVPPVPPLLLLDGNRYPSTGEGGFTNTIVSFWRTPTVCEVSNGCALSGDLRYFLSCAITIINTSASAWTGPRAAEHPEWFSDTNKTCHPHPHLEGAFSADLLNAFTGEVVRSEDDKGFCWRSLTRFFGTNGPLASACDAPVIQSGWGDTYDAGTLCNGIDVTGVPEGLYLYRITLDPLHRYGVYQALQQLVSLTATNVTKVSQPALAIADLGNSVMLTWSAPGNYRVQISNDLETWTTTESFVSSSPLVLPKNQPQQFFRLAMNP